MLLAVESPEGREEGGEKRRGKGGKRKGGRKEDVEACNWSHSGVSNIQEMFKEGRGGERRRGKRRRGR